MMYNTTNANATRKLSSAIKARTNKFSGIIFQMWANEHKDMILDRLYKRVIHSDSQLPAFVAYAETVLIDEPVNSHLGWFDDILGNVIDELTKIDHERLSEAVSETMRSRNTCKKLSACLKEQLGDLDPAFVRYLRSISSVIKHNVRQRMGYYSAGSLNEMLRYIDNTLADIPATENFGWFDDIVGTTCVVIEEYRSKWDEKHQSKASGGFDIYAWAEQYPGADYLEQSTGYIFRCADYMRAKSFGLPTPGIAVVDSMSGKLIGYAQK